jgi:hypothetical protein
MSEIPSTYLSNPHTHQLASLNSLIEVFEKINNNTSNLAEIIFDHLIKVSDEDLMSGKIPKIITPKNSDQLNGFLHILNNLFPLSHKDGLKIIKRDTVEYLNKKTYAWAMCFDGGESLDILCEIVNEENVARIPSKSPEAIKSSIQISVPKIDKNILVENSIDEQENNFLTPQNNLLNKIKVDSKLSSQSSKIDKNNPNIIASKTSAIEAMSSDKSRIK